MVQSRIGCVLRRSSHADNVANHLAGAAYRTFRVCREAYLTGNDVKELLRTNDLVLLSFVYDSRRTTRTQAEALLRDHDIEPLVLDAHTAILEGSIGAIQRRLMVVDDAYQRARWLLETHKPEGTDL